MSNLKNYLAYENVNLRNKISLEGHEQKRTQTKS